jgi:hypothetical protein
MAVDLNENKMERQIGQGWEGKGCPIIVKGTTAEYRRTIQKVAHPDDIAVEIGSAAGITTIILARICKRVIGVDFNHKCIKESIEYATKNGFRTSYNNNDTNDNNDDTNDTNDNDNNNDKHNNNDNNDNNNKPVVEFVVAMVKTGNKEKCLESLYELENALKTNGGYSLRDVSLLAIDIAGTAPIEMITPIINSLREVMRPRITVVKSLSLKKLSMALETGQSDYNDILIQQQRKQQQQQQQQQQQAKKVKDVDVGKKVNGDGGLSVVLVPASSSLPLQEITIDGGDKENCFNEFLEKNFKLKPGEIVNMDLVQNQANESYQCTSYVCPHVSPTTLRIAAEAGTIQRLPIKISSSISSSSSSCIKTNVSTSRCDIHAYFDESANLKGRPINQRAIANINDNESDNDKDSNKDIVHGDVFLVRFKRESNNNNSSMIPVSLRLSELCLVSPVADAL